MMHILSAILLVAVSFPCLAQQRVAQIASSSSGAAFNQIRLMRTACYGTCPIYSITISRSGTVRYDGVRFVGKVGKATSQLSQAQLHELRLALEKVNFFSLRNNYESLADGCPRTATDNPSAITTVSAGGRKKTVTRDLSCRESDKDDHSLGLPYPRALALFEDQIDQITNSKQWVEQPGQTDQ